MTLSIKVIGKYLDQPILVERFRKVVPYSLGAAACAYTAGNVVNQPNDRRCKVAVQTGVVLGATILSALAAPRIASAITKKKALQPLDELVRENTRNINEFVASNTVSTQVDKILNKAKKSILKPREIRVLMRDLSSKEEQKFLDKLIPPPENVNSKDIFSEIGWLSIVGAIPVIGGVAGGIAADCLSGENWRKKLPDKIKEGSYQYLANIFLCNVGAGAALAILEKNNIKSRMARGVGMLGGIILTGVIGGSKIANIIGDKLINPLFGMKKKVQKGDERTPELIDIGLHTDDIATVSLLSGLKWIEPALPILYTISGYRAGIGYRNSKDKA